MALALHHVIIGSGSAGFGAALTLREQDKECHITMITMDSLPFYHRYDLPQIFHKRHDWRELLDVPPSKYEELGIRLRRLSRVQDVDSSRQILRLAHQEEVSYDNLLVCAGGRSYLPENLSESANLMHGFGSFEAAMRVYNDLPQGGTVIIIGGDMVGIDLALTLLDTGYHVIIVTNQQTFWPHELSEAERQPLLGALAAKGMKIIDHSRAIGVSSNGKNSPARILTLEDGSEIVADVVMPFCGLSPSVEFMLGAGVDIERGLLVNTQLQTNSENIWAAGDVCQIWNDKEKIYKFYHGWKNVRIMGELAARNISGAHNMFDVNIKDKIELDKNGNIQSTFWIH